MTYYSVHEHSKYTSDIDKYWYFKNKQNAIDFYVELAQGYYRDEEVIVNTTDDEYYYDLGEGDYIELCKKNGIQFED
jgi:hypothetical protein